MAAEEIAKAEAASGDPVSAYSRDGFVHASIRIRLARSGAARI